MPLTDILPVLNEPNEPDVKIKLVNVLLVDEIFDVVIDETLMLVPTILDDVIFVE